MECFYVHGAMQTRGRNLRGSVEQDMLPIVLQFFKTTSVSSDAVIIERKGVFSLISETFSRMGVPEYEHPAALQRLFQVLEEAVDPEIAVLVAAFDNTTHFIGDDQPSRPRTIPASRSSIQGLELVKL